ncbi:STAS domain-containing protein [Mucilaginibacter sp. UR6-11]|uniref:STAS domain-containing protein n=1 Tax=Mucilaginibacter sp. UR6-11 TaxID=1435644 RepID=UPI001E28E09A|nr:STAS domain-containing protein [Mucilaginibacter sp. UR6-11]MCC8423762.1 STAS domain-containing protein [Mucilaginibacter sp. UR6-11]
MLKTYKEDEKNLMINLNLQEASLANADEFKTDLIKLFDAHHKRIVLNLEQVQYIDSSFLGALVSSLKYLMSFKEDLILVGLRPDIADMFALIRLDKIFNIYSDFSEAIDN